MLLGAFAMNAWAYDGSVVTPSEQTIYYNFNSSSQTITITYPNTADAPWSNYTKPTGDLVIPDSIEQTVSVIQLQPSATERFTAV